MLNIHSSFSLKYGVIGAEQLVEWYAQSGYNKVALTDINNTSAVLDFVRFCQKAGKVPVAGIDFRNGMSCQFVGIAKNNEGYCELNSLLTAHLHSGEPIPDRAPHMYDSFIIYPWGKEPAKLKRYERIGVAAHQLNKLRMAANPPLKSMVILEPMTFFNKKNFNTHRLLRAIHNNCLLSRLPVTEQTREDELFRSADELRKLFSDFPQLLIQTHELIAECGLYFGFGEESTMQNLATFKGSKEEDREEIRRICLENLTKRYPEVTQKIVDRMEMELEVITQKEYLSYFLIARHITSYARSKGYFYVGRGSGANSILAYLLEITDVDPLELDLYFERFINLYRQNPPDFDIDFSWRDREDITRYIFESFPNSALLGTYSTFQRRATIRELGKIFGLPAAEIDALNSRTFNPQQADQIAQLVLKYADAIAGLPSHLSVHAGGIIISEKPIQWYSATFLPPKGFPTTQFSMLEAEDVGLYKFDILSQRGLGKIRDALDIIEYNQPDNPCHDIHDVKVFMADPKVNSLLNQAGAIGCFYVESPAMRMLMTKLQTNNYLELVAASSIVRPGVAQSGMMREYIVRHRIPEKRSEAHWLMNELMPETYGVMVYQEDVIKVAHHFGGLTLAESDVLRRGMSGKFRSRSEFQRVKDRFFSNCAEKGFELSEVLDIWNQIESFAGFSFAKGHSASYAVESYQSLYLKAYYPLEYMVATLNNGGGYYSPELYLHEARKCGAIVVAPCLNRGEYETVIQGNKIILGFQHVHGIESRLIDKIFENRRNHGPFQSLDDLLNRVLVPLEQLLLLIRSGALRTTGENKRKLMWQAHFFHNHNKDKKVTNRLFAEPTKTFELPSFEENTVEEAFEQIELLGFPLCDPFSLASESFQPHPVVKELPQYHKKYVITYGYLVTTKETLTQKTRERMVFATFIDTAGEQMDTVAFPNIATQFAFSGKGIYELRGVVTEDFDFYTIELSSFRKIPYREDPRYLDE